MPAHTTFDIEAILKSMDAIEYGVVHWFNNEYGFGFITPDGGGPDIFVHISEIAGNGSQLLEDGRRVSYLVGGAPCRPQAQTVHVL
jgi:CspA family cold shock protein